MVIPVVLISTTLFLAMVVNLAVKPSFSSRLTAALMLVSVVGGNIFYGTGYAQNLHDPVQAVIRTPLSVIGMFLGKNDLTQIVGTSLVSNPAGVSLFWLLHSMAFYSMASAAMITIGAEALRQLRLMLSARGDLTLIFGINEHCLDVGRECLSKGGNSVVFITESAQASVINEINNKGMSILTGNAAVSSEEGVMKRLRVRFRKITVFALDEEEDRDLFYALRLKDALEKAGVPSENTRITLPGAEDIIAPMLQVSEEQYGFGYVNVFDAASLAARAMIRLCPPWEQIRFDSYGRAKEDFSCIVAGFGMYGQAVLKYLVMNGQFAGSSFHAAVFSPDYEKESGYLQAECPELFRRYDIRSFTADARSSVFFKYVEENLSALKMIVVCTGDEVLNSEISDNLMLFLKRRGAERICVVQCGKSGARYQETVGSEIQRAGIYTLDLLSAELADRQAVVLNSIYDSSDKTPWEKWVACDTFSKMSSRASADFVPAFLRAAGKTAEEALAGSWDFSEQMQQNLGETEHVRWCAFHYAMGYAAMPEEIFSLRARKIREAKAAGEPCSLRAAKDSERRLHACLIPWDELDELDARELRETGRKVHYKQYDIDNVMAVPELLRSAAAPA